MREVREGYKITELGQIPRDWEINYLKDICEFMNGKAHEDIVDENGDYILVNSKFVSTEGRVLKKVTENISPLLKDDIAIVMSDIPKGRAFAKCFLVEENNKYTLNQRVGLIRTNLLVPKYLFYQLNRNSYFLKFDDGVSQTNIRKPDLLQCPVLVPTYKEQQKITSILSTVDKHIDETEQLIVKTKELKKGLMQQLLTKGIGHTEFKQTELGEIPSEWEVKDLSSLGEWIGGGTPSKSDVSNWSNEKEVLWVTSTDMHKSFISETELYITEKGRLEKNLKLLPVDTLIFVMRSGILKRYLPVALAKKELTINQDQKAFICNDTCIPLYIYYTIQTFNKKLRDTYVKTGTTVESIDFSGFKQFKLALPKLEEQQKIASILSTVDEQIEVYEEEKAKCKELKKGLMQKLLTGQIRVKC